MRKKKTISTGNFYKQLQLKPYPFQEECMKFVAEDYSGILLAPTGSGKTLALFIPMLQKYLSSEYEKKEGLFALWITPLKSLSKEIKDSCQQVCDTLNTGLKVALRNGDTSTAERAKQKKSMPFMLVITPESIHLLFTQPGYENIFKNLQYVIVDEWHELLGSKRGVLIELALSRLKKISPKLKQWAISATIGNIEQAEEVFFGIVPPQKRIKVSSGVKKTINVFTIFPDTLSGFSMYGHLGLSLVEKVVEIIHQFQTTLVFTNTRAQAEIWYGKIIDDFPELAGQIAIHHGSLSNEIRQWVENALDRGILKALICTSSLDLGVDFKPVDCVVQIGSAKGVSRFVQRAGRSGHSPGAESNIYFCPTHSMEIIEGAALRTAILQNKFEKRIPFIRSFDLLIQYMVTLSISEGFEAEKLFDEIKSTHCFESITKDEFFWCLQFIVNGGSTLNAYDEFKKVIWKEGTYKIANKYLALRHKLHIGAIVSDNMINVKFIRGKKLGMIEEWFISKLKKGDVFRFAGRTLEFFKLEGTDVLVKRSNKKTSNIPAYMGGRMPLSSELGKEVYMQLQNFHNNKTESSELNFIKDMLAIQSENSHIPLTHEFLIEKYYSKQGYHYYFYPFQGRLVHEGLAALLVYRISKEFTFSASLSFNDYGFEILSNEEIPEHLLLSKSIWSITELSNEITNSVNSIEMARRRFREIAGISGLIFQGFKNRPMKDKHLHASAKLFFEVFEDVDKDNLLLKQAYQEVLDFQLEFTRLYEFMKQMKERKIVIKALKNPSPFSFPLLAERLRERFSNESYDSKIEKMINELNGIHA